MVSPHSLRRAGFAFGALALTLVATGCTANEAFFFNQPEPATEQGPIMINLWQGSWIAAWGVGVVTWGLMFWAAVVYRRRHKNDAPAQTKYNLPLEVLYTIVPLIMILGLFWFTARDQTEILTVKNDQQQTVNVVGWKWSWGFNYVDQKVWDAGTPDHLPELVLPVNEKVRFELTSADVIHSFWVPSFLFKMDVIPGKTNVFELTPNKIGEYVGKCAELCGTYHSKMLFNVKVVSKPDFDAYLAGLKAKGQTGVVNSSRVTNTGQTIGEQTTL
jgi:cytochrome c oxidase subunit 2